MLFNFERGCQQMKQVRSRIFSPQYQGNKKAQIARQGFFTIPDNLWFDEERSIMVTIHSHPLTKAKAPVPHNHDFFELCYVYQGNFYNIIDGCEIVQQSNTLILLSPQAVHSTYIKKDSDIVFNILIQRSLVENLLVRILDSHNVFCRFFLDNLYLTNRYKPYMVFQCTDILLRGIQEIIQEFFDQRPFYQNVMTVKILELILEISRISNCELERNNEASGREQTSDEMMQYIRRNYATVTLESVSAAFHYSPSYISQTIKNEYQMNFSQIISRLKLQNACYYLKNSSLPIEQIIELVGYKDISYFYKIFRRSYQISPKKYRELHQRGRFI